MRNKIFSFALLFAAACGAASNNFAQQPGCPDVKSVSNEHFDADDYAELRENAPEELEIVINEIKITRRHQQNTLSPKYMPGLPPVLKSDYVEIKAMVTAVKRSQSKLKKDDLIEIHYTTNRNWVIRHLEKWEALTPLLMEVSGTYKVYVKRVRVQSGTDDDDGYRYIPWAYSQSFEPVKTEKSKK